MRLTLPTLLHFRSAVMMLLKAIDAALLEGYGWTPRRSTADVDGAAYNECSTPVRAEA